MPKEFVNRLEEEAKVLGTNVLKLQTYLDSSHCDINCTPFEVDKLNEQLGHMQKYYGVISYRLGLVKLAE